jgi:hypothetical protein
VKGEKLSLRFVLLFAAVFALTRVVVHLSGSPYFDPDTYKYLAGADSLVAGKGLPRLFTDLPLNGAALHVVPGYSFLAYAIWKVGGISLQSLAVVQSVVSFAGFLAFAHLIARWIGCKTAIAVFIALSVSPSIAWLEHSLMPDSIAAPLLMIALWAAAWGSPSSSSFARRTAAPLLAGLIIGFEILLRHELASVCGAAAGLGAVRPQHARPHARVDGSVRSRSRCAAGALGARESPAPWRIRGRVQQRQEPLLQRRLVGNARRARELEKYGIKQAPLPRSAYALADTALQRQLAAA